MAHAGQDVMNKLQELARRHRVAPEDLVRASVEELRFFGISRG